MAQVNTRKKRKHSSVFKQRLKEILRLFLNLCFFAPILLFMMYINYTVDRQGVFQGEQTLRTVVSHLTDGKNIGNYEKFNERQRDLIQLWIENLPSTPYAVALGSSRIMQLNAEIAGVDSKNFLNAGLTGADFLDIISTYYLLEKNQKLPKVLIIGVDPWIFNKNSIDARSDKTLYAEFLTQKLGIPTPYTKSNPNEKWKALYSPSYFQGNIDYLRRNGKNTSLETKEITLISDDALFSQNTEVKRSDGSIVYPVDMREKSQQEIDTEAFAMTNIGLFNLEDYEEIDPFRLSLFERFLTYVQQQNIQIILMLTPYHPIDYDYIREEKPDHYAAFLYTEPTIHRIAEKLSIPVYGSYNPYAIPHVKNTDFFDAIHTRGSGIQKFFPGIPKALENLTQNISVRLNEETTKKEASLRDQNNSLLT